MATLFGWPKYYSKRLDRYVNFLTKLASFVKLIREIVYFLKILVLVILSFETPTYR